MRDFRVSLLAYDIWGEEGRIPAIS